MIRVRIPYLTRCQPRYARRDQRVEDQRVEDQRVEDQRVEDQRVEDQRLPGPARWETYLRASASPC